MSPREYFISFRGHDRGPGSRKFPWRTLSRVSQAHFSPGDRILLEGGGEYPGSLLLIDAMGTPNLPITVESYGKGRARILAGHEGGVLLWNSHAVLVSNLEIVGEGHPQNRADGVCVFSDRARGRELGFIVLEDLEISGFGHCGISIGGKEGGGFQNISLRRLHVHHNSFAGIFVWSDTPDYAHRDFSVQECTTHSNSGILGLSQHSGHGILLTSVDTGNIEKCRAYNNGFLNTANVCGPAGIWAAESKRIRISRNESFQNHTASATDGGGFGLDGGVTDSVMENNFSHGNDGPGFLFSQYYGAKPFLNNRMIGNVSENDARKNDNGAVHIWAPDANVLRNCAIVGNRIQLTPAAQGRARALFIEGCTREVNITENSFVGQGSSTFIEVAANQRRLNFRGNRFHNAGGMVRWQGKYFANVPSWLEVLPQADFPAFVGNHLLQGSRRLPHLPKSKYGGEKQTHAE